MVTNKITAKCEECGIGMYRRPSEIEASKSGVFFCCGEHRKMHTAKNKIPNTKCGFCSKEFWRKESSKQNSKSGLFFCSKEHQSLAFAIDSNVKITSGPRPLINPLTNERVFATSSGKRFICILCNKKTLESERQENSYCLKCSYLPRWLRGEESGTTLANEMKLIVRIYIKQLKGEQCWTCGWNEINPLTGKIPVQIDHIDGDSGNNKLENLQLLCPNHHSLTPTFGNNGGRSGKSGRINRYKK